MGRRLGSLAAHAAIFAVFGVLAPYLQGFDFLDAVVLLAYSCLPAVLAAHAAVEAVLVTGSAPGVSVRRSAAYGWGCGIAIVTLGLITVNVSLRPPEPLLPPLPLVLAIGIVSLAASFCAASAATLIALRQADARSAKATLRTGFLALLLLWLFAGRILPEAWMTALIEQTTAEGITRLALGTAALLGAAGAALLALALKSRLAPQPPSR